MPGTHPRNILVGGRKREYPQYYYVLSDIAESRPMLVALRSLSLKPISFGYKTGVPLPHPTPFGGSSPNLELALTPLDTKEGTRSVPLSRRQGSILPPAAAAS